MELYKIVFAEFEKFKSDESYPCSSFGTTSKIYKNEEECVLGIFNEYDYIKNRSGYEKVEVLNIGKYEFKLRCTVKNERKTTIHHYKIVKFNVD